MAQEVPRGPYAMGRVSIGAQWTAVAFGFLLSPLFVVFMVWFVGWLVYCRLWPRRGVVPGSVEAAVTAHTALAPACRVRT
jgi:hypothetical protein